MTLRARFEERYGKVEDGFFQHVLELALIDQNQYRHLQENDLQSLLDPTGYPPSNSETERIDEIRARLLESMVIIAGIVKRIREP